ncbi:MAG TPA: MogA/MoaB family molybdenum cofactor biosynthesis protein [Capsulimonadaceae bacterium]|nr:MogA/MoaB family molybdenum cofactor biosynthesis protein [Capsulimonadaceae bacterium]
MEPIRVGVLTVSDRCSRGEAQDKSGPAIIDSLPPGQYHVALAQIVPDDPDEICAALTRWADESLCDLILTTGGTGFSPRDVTPEATRRVIEREAAGIAILLAQEGLKKTPFAALSRGTAGIRAGAVIINLPGSPAGAREGVQALLPILPHAVDVLKNREQGHPG